MKNVRLEKHSVSSVNEHCANEHGANKHSKNHSGENVHHHHSHKCNSQHVGGHHLLQVEHLTIAFDMYENTNVWNSQRRVSKVIDGLNISVHSGEIIAIVGASGAGKTLLADAIMGIYEPNSYVSGTIYFDGKKQTAQTLRQLRGKEIAFVPQSVSALNPLMKVGKQIGGNKAKRHELYRQYHLDSSVETSYPFELSGGMARRILLCSALVNSPKLIIADEPTPGLDLDLALKAMDDFRAFANCGGAVLLITHDIELALHTADRVAIFNDGCIVEETSVQSFEHPDNLRTEFARKLWYAMPQNGFSCGLCSEETVGLGLPSTLLEQKVCAGHVQEPLDGGGDKCLWRKATSQKNIHKPLDGGGNK